MIQSHSKHFRTASLCVLLPSCLLQWENPARPIAETSSAEMRRGSRSTIDAGEATAMLSSQVGDLSYRLVSAGGRRVDDPRRPIGKEACREGTLIVGVAGIDFSRPGRFEAWLSTGSGQCERADRGSRGVDRLNCTQLEVLPSQLDDFEGLLVPLRIDPICAAGDGPHSLYILAFEGQSEGDAENYGVFSLAIDTTAPDPGRDLRLTTKSSEAVLTWSSAPSAANYLILVDSNARLHAQAPSGTSDACANSILHTGDDVTQVLDTVASFPVWGDEMAVISRDLIAQSDGVAVAVASADFARNFSTISEVICFRPGAL